MNHRTLRKPAARSKGITLIEILMVVALLAILLSFAMPSMSGAVSKAEFNSTLENVHYSLLAVRQAARISETAVSMNISPAAQDAIQTISFSSPDDEGAGSKLHIQDFSLPPGIVLISDQESYVFDERGLVERPGRILLVSKLDESVTSTIAVD